MHIPAGIDLKLCDIQQLLPIYVTARGWTAMDDNLLGDFAPKPRSR